MEDGAHDELELLKRMAARDEIALGQLYDRFSKPLYSLALRTLHNEREAEEAVQDAFLAAWQQADSYDASRGAVFTWLVGITRYKCLDRLRKAKRRLPAPERNPAPSRVPERICLESDPATAAHQRELTAHIRSMVGALPEAQRRVLELAFFDGLTHVEIAEHLSEAVGTVKSRIRLAMEKLRNRV